MGINDQHPDAADAKVAQRSQKGFHSGVSFASFGCSLLRPLRSAARSCFPAALAALAVATASAQTVTPAVPPMAKPAAPVVFAIRGFRIEGENPIGEADAQRVLAPFVRPDATLATLQRATAALEAALRARGFGLHRVALPPQEVGATVRLEVVTFTITRITTEGRSLYSEENVRRALPELKEGTTPNFKRLAIET